MFDDLFGDFDREIRDLARVDESDPHDDAQGLWDSGEEQSFWTATPDNVWRA